VANSAISEILDTSTIQGTTMMTNHEHIDALHAELRDCLGTPHGNHEERRIVDLAWLVRLAHVGLEIESGDREATIHLHLRSARELHDGKVPMTLTLSREGSEPIVVNCHRPARDLPPRVIVEDLDTNEHAF
jgi:hypothetical protein